MDYEDDLNCVRIASHKHGDMTLSQVAERLGLTSARIHQIEKDALTKMKKLM
jgi:DNA-directed RNA polymerase sigma subunit (sigma70/sigma32)